MKPSLFKNELLATSDPIYAWVFEGLWCIADREGRLEDRPRRIHLEINAGRAYETTEGSLNWLTENGFIRRYENGGVRYIQVEKFSKHQNPHIREPASTIPAPDEHSAGTVPEQCGHQSGPALSPFPLPDSPSLTAPPAVAKMRKRVPRGTDPEWLLDFKLAYPDRVGSQEWRKALSAANARMSEGHTPDEFIAGAKRYAAHCDALGKTGTEYVKQAATFLGPDKHFLEQWALPIRASAKAPRLQKDALDV